MAVSSLTLSFASTALTNRLYVRDSTYIALSSRHISACSSNTSSDEAEGKFKRRTIAIGIGALSLNLFPACPLLAEGIPENYEAFIDKIDGYSYYYPSDWREFDFRGHDSAFKDRYLQLQNVRLSFIPTDKTDIHDLGPMEEELVFSHTNRNYPILFDLLAPLSFGSAPVSEVLMNPRLNVSGKCKRRTIAIGIGALSLNFFPACPLLAEGIPENYEAFIDKIDGYSYYYPSDWRDFDFRGHDSAFKDRYLQLQNVRLSFIPTDKTDIHDLGPMEEGLLIRFLRLKVVLNLVRNVYSAPTQVEKIVDMQEKTIDGRTYCTFEYILTSPNFSRAAFATIAIGNGRYYTLIVGANERRWRRVRNKLKVVADSFKVLDI
ncbi:photosynthetic NDH subunit of lumenal location 1, chloroplastic [Olea europaea subsp. europaea]|uniref:Photosynthetic NDH subunit of lumenal location 1, chloroplastic n=1 Tax=Olea europaea subsp. europaea TaxID=158383 RepID=A0A8S0QE67_OLEEU|nr:photosynthetic NDH subunit of lumenal location 1, chloroplastic [Olea europaea subsp. europaea]